MVKPVAVEEAQQDGTGPTMVKPIILEPPINQDRPAVALVSPAEGILPTKPLELYIPRPAVAVALVPKDEGPVKLEDRAVAEAAAVL